MASSCACCARGAPPLGANSRLLGFPQPAKQIDGVPNAPAHAGHQHQMGCCPNEGIGFSCFFVCFWWFCLLYCCFSLPLCATFFFSELEAKHCLVLLQSWLVWHYGIPLALGVSRDLSGILLFPRWGKHRAKKGAKEVPSIVANDKWALTIDVALMANGQVVPPQVIFESTADRGVPKHTLQEFDPLAALAEPVRNRSLPLLANAVSRGV